MALSLMGINCLKAIKPLRGDGLRFTIQFPGVRGTQMIHLRRMKGCVDLGTTQWF